MTARKKIGAKRAEFEELLKNNGNFLTTLVKESLQEVLEAEIIYRPRPTTTVCRNCGGCTTDAP